MQIVGKSVWKDKAHVGLDLSSLQLSFKYTAIVVKCVLNILQ